MLKLETARAKDRVCGDRAKSGTHQLLLMMRACGYCATQAASVERQACYCKRSICAPPLLSASGFLRLVNTGFLQGFGTTAQMQAEQWEPKQGPARLVHDLTTAHGHPSALARFNLSMGLRPGRHVLQRRRRHIVSSKGLPGTVPVLFLLVFVHRDCELLSFYPQFI